MHLQPNGANPSLLHEKERLGKGADLVCYLSAFCFSFFQEQFSSVTQSCLTLCNPMNRSMPGLPVYHQLPEFTQTHVHWEKAIATHSSTLAWKIPWTEEPGRLQFMGLQRVGHD